MSGSSTDDDIRLERSATQMALLEQRKSVTTKDIELSIIQPLKPKITTENDVISKGLEDRRPSVPKDPSASMGK